MQLKCCGFLAAFRLTTILTTTCALHRADKFRHALGAFFFSYPGWRGRDVLIVFEILVENLLLMEFYHSGNCRSGQMCGSSCAAFWSAIGNRIEKPYVSMPAEQMIAQEE